MELCLEESKDILTPQVVAAGKELYSTTVADTLTTVWEELTGEKADRRTAVLCVYDGTVNFMDKVDTLQDGFIALAPLYAGSPTYLKSVESICYKTKKGQLSFCKAGEISQDLIDMKLHNLHLSLQVGIIMHMRDLDDEE